MLSSPLNPYNIDQSNGASFNTWSDPSPKAPNTGKTLVQQARVFNSCSDEAERDFRARDDDLGDSAQASKSLKEWAPKDGQLAFARFGRIRTSTYSNGCAPLNGDSTKQALVSTWTSFDGIKIDGDMTAEDIRNSIMLMGLTRFDSRVDAHGNFSVMDSGVASMQYRGKKPIYAGQLLTYTFADDKDFESKIDMTTTAHERSQCSIAYVCPEAPMDYRYSMKLVADRLHSPQFVKDGNLLGIIDSTRRSKQEQSSVADRMAANEYCHCETSFIQGAAALAATGKGVVVTTQLPSTATALRELVRALQVGGGEDAAFATAKLAYAQERNTVKASKEGKGKAPASPQVDPAVFGETALAVADAIGFSDGQQDVDNMAWHNTFIEAIIDNYYPSSIWHAASLEGDGHRIAKLQKHCALVESYLCPNRYLHLQSFLSNCLGKAHSDALPNQYVDISFDHIELTARGYL